MAVIPDSVVESVASSRFVGLGYEPAYRGKVGELFRIPNKPDQMLMMRSDRLSIFDFVLPCEVEFKGEVLIAMTHWWLTEVFSDVPNHLLAAGMDEEAWGNAGWNMDDVVDLPLERTMLIEANEVWPYEMIYRHHIGGSVWRQYQSDGTACGNVLPPNLSKWQKLDSPIFTPTTKAESGHDIAVDISQYAAETGETGQKLAEMFGSLYARGYALLEKNGLLILDTKFEGSPNGKILDEILTPDASRITTKADLERAIAEKRDPIFFDKEPVRVWGREVETPWGVGINNLDPENDEHLDFVASLEIPTEITRKCSERYLEIFSMLPANMDLGEYQELVMGIGA